MQRKGEKISNSKTNLGSKNTASSEQIASNLVWLGILAYAIVYGIWSIKKVTAFEADAFDLGIYDQTLWQIAHFQSLFNTIRGMNLFGDHFTPILFLLAPIYWFIPEPQGLVAFQSAALALGAWPIYRIARHHSAPPAAAAGLSFTYLFAPALGYPTLFDFHPNMPAAPILLFAIDAMERENYRMLAVWVLLALCCRQDIALSVAVYGIAIMLRSAAFRGGNSPINEPKQSHQRDSRQRRNTRLIAGFAVMMSGIVWLLICLPVMHRLSGAGTGYVALYSYLGRTPLQIVMNVLLHPIRTISYAVPGNVNFMLRIIIPAAGLCLLCPELLLAALPELMMDLLSTRQIMQTIYAQYTPAILPFVYGAAAIGLGRLWYLLKRFDLIPRYGGELAGLVLLLLGTFCFWSFGPWENMAYLWKHAPPQVALQERNAILAEIPPQASVSASPSLVVHLAHRDQIYMFPNPFIKAWYGAGAAVIRQEDLNYHPPLPAKLKPLLSKYKIDYIVATDPEQYKPLLQAAVKYGYYKIVSTNGDMLVLKRCANIINK